MRNYYRKYLFLALVAWSVLAILATPLAVRAGEAEGGPPPALSLQSALGRVEKRSAELEELRKKMQSAHLELQNVAPKYLPKLAAAAQYRLDNGENVGYDYGRVIPMLTASYDFLDTDSDLYKRRWMAMKEYFQAEEALIGARERLYLETAVKYFSLLLSRGQSDLAIQLRQQSQSENTKAEIEFGEGRIPQVELLKVQTAAARGALEALKRSHELEVAEMELAGLLDLPAAIAVAEPEGEVALYRVDSDRLKKFVAEHNGHLRLMNEVAEQVPEFRRLADRLRWPSVKLETYLGEQDNNYAGPGANDYGVRLTVSKDIFDNGNGRRRREKMILDISALESAVRGRRQTFFDKLEVLRRKFDQAGEEISQAEKQLELTRELTRLFAKSYDLGVASLAELQKNRDQLRANEYEYLQARTRYRECEFALKVHAGVDSPEELARSGAAWLAGTPQEVSKENK